MKKNEEVVNWLLQTYPQAVEVLTLDSLFPQAREALTDEGFLHVFPQIFLIVRVFFVARLRKNRLYRSAACARL